MLHPHWIKCWRLKEAVIDFTDDDVTLLLSEMDGYLDAMNIWSSLPGAGKTATRGEGEARVEYQIPLAFGGGDFPPEYFLAMFGGRNSHIGLLHLAMRLYSDLQRVATIFPRDTVNSFVLDDLLPAIYEDKAADFAPQGKALLDALYSARPDAEYQHFNSVFTDSILLRKDVSVRHLLHCGLSFRDEVKGLSRAYIDADLASLAKPPPPAEPTSATKPTPRPEKPKMEVTQKEAAVLAGVSTRTLRAWERGEGTPQGYPGLSSRSAYMAFIERHESDKRFRKAAREIERAAPSGDMDDFGNLEEE